MPADEVATVEDARLTPASAALADGRGELTALALWLLAERTAVRLPGPDAVTSVAASQEAEGDSQWL